MSRHAMIDTVGRAAVSATPMILSGSVESRHAPVIGIEGSATADSCAGARPAQAGRRSGDSVPPAQNVHLPARECAKEAIYWLERMGPFDPGRVQALIDVMTWVTTQHEMR